VRSRKSTQRLVEVAIAEEYALWPRTLVRERRSGREEEATDTDEVMRRILDTYEAGDLITTCAWCGRVTIDGEWVLAPRAALTAIDSPLTLSHSICPQCAVAQPTSASSPELAQP
jgi:hypothetical protein